MHLQKYIACHELRTSSPIASLLRVRVCGLAKVSISKSAHGECESLRTVTRREVSSHLRQGIDLSVIRVICRRKVMIRLMLQILLRLKQEYITDNWNPAYIQDVQDLAMRCLHFCKVRIHVLASDTWYFCRRRVLLIDTASCIQTPPLSPLVPFCLLPNST